MGDALPRAHGMEPGKTTANEPVGKEANMAGEAQDQLKFEGLAVDGVRFGLKSATDLYGGKDEELHIGEKVGGEWSGEVVGVSFDKNPKTGEIVRCHHIAIDRSTIGGY